MFGRRSDGKPVKGLGLIEKAVPHFMPGRSESLNMMTHALRCEGIDAFIERKRAEGKSYNYMDIITASMVRLVALRPYLNRFVMRGKIYERKGVFVAITVKKSLKDTGNETTVKVGFTGKETLDEVKEKFNAAINDAFAEEASSEKTLKKFMWLPNWLIRGAVGFLRWLDKHGMLPKKLIEVSPFHTSVYLTNLKSIKCDAVQHHLYNFGTATVFVAMGKEKEVPVVEDGELKVGKVMNLGITIDERPVDGFYFARSLRIWDHLLSDPSLLEKPVSDSDVILM